jgi:hypothetical protein
VASLPSVPRLRLREDIEVEIMMHVIQNPIDGSPDYKINSLA